MLSNRFRVFPFGRPSYCPDCCCSAAAYPPWVGRLPCCRDLLVAACLPASAHTLLPAANSRSPTPTISVLNRTSNFQSSSCFIKRPLGGSKRCAGLIRAITMPEGQNLPDGRLASLNYQEHRISARFCTVSHGIVRLDCGLLANDARSHSASLHCRCRQRRAG